jgi:hypothetical protein
MQRRLKQKFLVDLSQLRTLTEAEVERWNNVIVEKALKAPPDNNPILTFNWGMWVTDGKECFVFFHEQLKPYTGKYRVGQRVKSEVE